MRGDVRRRLAWLRGVGGLAVAQLRHAKLHTALSVLAIALAVLSVTLLASAGFGAVAAGEQRLAEADRDLWLTDEGVELSAAGVENGIVDAHAVADEVESHEDVEGAAPLAFHGTYVTNAAGDTEYVTGVGVPTAHAGLALEAGTAFEGDLHYADGAYDGPRTDEVLVDPATADALDLEPGDTVTVATSPAGEGREVTVVGVSATYSDFLGAPTLVAPLSELQALAGTTGSDRAALVTVTVADDADVEAVRDDLERDLPYEVRTNREQLAQVFESQALLFASAAALVALAVLVGAAVVLNVLVLATLRRADELAALRALGLSRRTLCGVAAARSGAIAAAGGTLGLAATPLFARALDAVAARLVGYAGLVAVTPRVYWLGAGVAAGIGLVGALLVGWYVATRVPHVPE